MNNKFSHISNAKLNIMVGFSESELASYDNKLLDFPEGLDMFLEEDGNKLRKNYLTYFQDIKEPQWITYEEYFIFKTLIELLITDQNEISVIYNNRYLSVYPYNNSFSNIDTFYEYLYEREDYEANDLDKKINEIYTSIHNINGDYYVSIDSGLLDQYNEINYYQNEKELEQVTDLTEKEYDYFFEYNDDPKALVNLNIFLEKNKNKTITLSLPLSEEIELTLKRLAYIFPENTFLIYRPIIDKKIIYREKEYKALLQKYWGHKYFKELDMYKDTRSRELTKVSQAQIIDDIVSQMENSIERRTPRDLFVTSSTGAGKSLMFQLPSLYIKDKYPDHKRLTIIISPLIGLMNDQVESLNKRKITNAKTINSGLSPGEKSLISQDIKNGNIDILYISIETLINSADIQYLIGDRKIGLFVVDEAHTVTTWGRTFRVDYWYMGGYLNRLRKEHNFPIVTFTATAVLGGPDDMYGEIKKSLNLVSPIQYIGKVTKDNIYMNIRTVDEKTKKQSGNDAAGVKDKATLARSKQAVKEKKKMLIYFPTVMSLRRFNRMVSHNAPELIEHITSYHGQLRPEDKDINFKDFKSGKRKIMLATKAFGMGIDIPDIEIVYHYAITGNLLDYIQEIGRVARKHDLKGQAMLDYLPNKDFNEYKQLRGMSSMKKYQLIDVMDKILTLYSNSGNKRHLNVNIESFDYIFNKDDDEQTDEELEKKVKLALLTIENDFKNKLSYPPFVSRPGSTNSEDFILVNDPLLSKIKDARYQQYFVKICDLENSYYNSIYTFRTEEYWKNNFNRISYRQFKYFLAKRGEEIKRDPLLLNLNFAVKYKVIYSKDTSEKDIHSHLEDIINKIEEALRGFATSQSHFTDEDFSKNLRRIMNLKPREADRIASTVINTLVQIDHLKGTKSILRYPSNEKYRIDNNYEDLLGILLETLNKLITKTAKNVEQYYINYYLIRNVRNDEIDYYNILLGFLETFGLVSFELFGGNRPSISLRINAVSQMERYVENPIKYDNKILSDQYFTYLRALEMYKYLFSLPKNGDSPNDQIINYTNDFWKTVEDYFFGIIPSKVEHILYNK